MVFRSPCTAALAALATRSWRLSGRQEEKEAATTASRIRPAVRIRLVGEENLFQARANHWSTSRVRSGATRDCASDVWPVPGGSPSTDLPEGVTWKTLRHFLQTRRVRTLSLGTRPSAPQAGHLIAIIWNCPPRITQASSQNWSMLLSEVGVLRNCLCFASDGLTFPPSGHESSLPTTGEDQP